MTDIEDFDRLVVFSQQQTTIYLPITLVREVREIPIYDLNGSSIQFLISTPEKQYLVDKATGIDAIQKLNKQ